MAGGGSGFKLKIINFVVDNPGTVYLGGAAYCYFYRAWDINHLYGFHFGRFDFQRKMERHEAPFNQIKH